jgi:hypothetical protein
LIKGNNEMELYNENGESALKFSTNFFNTKLKPNFEKGFEIDKAIINYIVFWYSDRFSKEIKVVLPVISLKRP